MSSSSSIPLSPNTQAVLLLTAPLIAGRADASSDLLTAREYQRLARLLNQMRRNKLIYALADAALVVNSDYEKGGTWAGAVEQLEKLHLVPMYVRTDGDGGKGLEALRRKGALPWPNPPTPEAFVETLTGNATGSVDSSSNRQLSFLGP